MNRQDLADKIQLFIGQLHFAFSNDIQPASLNPLQVNLKQANRQQQHDAQQQLQPTVESIAFFPFDGGKAVDQDRQNQDERNNDKVEHERRAESQKSILHRNP